MPKGARARSACTFPDDDAVVVGACGTSISVSHRKRTYRTGVPDNNDPIGGDRRGPGGTVSAGRQDDSTSVTEQRRHDRSCVTRDDVQHRLVLWIPESSRPVLACGQDHAVIRAEHRAGNGIPAPDQSRAWLARPGVPHERRPVLTRSYERVSIWAERDVDDVVAVPKERRLGYSLRRAPKTRGAVRTRSGHEFSSRAECDIDNAAFMTP